MSAQQSLLTLKKLSGHTPYGARKLDQAAGLINCLEWYTSLNKSNCLLINFSCIEGKIFQKQNININSKDYHFYFFGYFFLQIP